MKLDDETTFPKFFKYVKYSMPQVINVPVIVANLKRFGSLTSTEIRHALRYGTDPLIVVKDLSNFQCSVQAANGCFVNSRPNQIELDTDTVTQFENGGGTDVNSAGRAVFVVGTTILHEMCHWGNFKHGVDEATEQGIAFEVATYGRNTG